MVRELDNGYSGAGQNKVRDREILSFSFPFHQQVVAPRDILQLVYVFSYRKYSNIEMFSSFRNSVLVFIFIISLVLLKTLSF